MTTKEELESLKKQIAELESKIASEEKQEIKTVEYAFNKLNPKWFLSSCGKINESINLLDFKCNQCNMTSEKEAKRMKALIQLRLIAEAMNIGVESSKEYFYVTRFLDVDWITYTSVSLVLPIFNKRELAKQALKNFRPLFEDLYAE